MVGFCWLCVCVFSFNSVAVCNSLGLFVNLCQSATNGGSLQLSAS